MQALGLLFQLFVDILFPVLAGPREQSMWIDGPIIRRICWSGWYGTATCSRKEQTLSRAALGIYLVTPEPRDKIRNGRPQ